MVLYSLGLFPIVSTMTLINRTKQQKQNKKIRRSFLTKTKTKRLNQVK